MIYRKEIDAVMNNLKVLNIVEDGLIVCGVAISLQQLYTIFGIVLLVIQIALIIAKGVIKVVDLVKKKKYQEAVNVIEETQKEINDVTEKQKDNANG